MYAIRSYYDINFSEQQLVARWGEQAWLNEAGELLRLADTSTADLDLPELNGPQGTHAHVITSYSIHYTKLYDF